MPPSASLVLLSCPGWFCACSEGPEGCEVPGRSRVAQMELGLSHGGAPFHFIASALSPAEHPSAGLSLKTDGPGFFWTCLHSPKALAGAGLYQLQQFLAFRLQRALLYQPVAPRLSQGEVASPTVVVFFLVDTHLSSLHHFVEESFPSPRKLKQNSH